MNFDKFNALVETKSNYGEIKSANVVSEFKNSGCGDNYRVFLEIHDGIIKNASFTTTGCSFSLASLSIICDLAKGMTLEEAKKISLSDMEKPIEGYPVRRQNYANTAISALNKAISDFENGTGLDSSQIITREGTLDLLKENGHLKDKNLNSVMLDTLDLSGVDFSGASLQNAFLKNCNLKEAIFENCNLKGAYLNDSDLSGASFENADLRFAKLSGATIEKTGFKNAIYDIGTRVDAKNTHIFDEMQKKGKEIYLAKS